MSGSYYPSPESMDHLVRILAAFTNYEKSEAFHKGRVRLNLQKMRRLCRAAGDPQHAVPSVHITGSKGKGSTALICAALLDAQGIDTGVFTSPHLERLNERINLKGAPLSDAAFLKAADEALDTLRRDQKLSATFFEFMTLTAMLAFRAGPVRAAVFEVGIGGRLDSTNVLRPAAAVITSIEREHCALLGETLEKIAGEKAGILKRKVPLVTALAPGHPGRSLLEARAASVGAPFLGPGRGLELREKGGKRFVEIEGKMHGPIDPPRPAVLQAWNTACALASARILVERMGLDWQEERALAALENLRLPGRFEIGSENPWVIVDGAHTVASLEASLEEAKALAPGGVRAVLGLARDKALEEILPLVESQVKAVFFTPYGGGRAAPAELLRDLAEGRGIACACPEEAIEKALAGLGRDQALLVTGSFYLAGEARKLLREKGYSFP